MLDQANFLAPQLVAFDHRGIMMLQALDGLEGAIHSFNVEGMFKPIQQGALSYEMNRYKVIPGNIM